MINAKEFVKAFKALEETKNIPAEIVIDSLRQALILAYQAKVENGNKQAMARVDIDEKKGVIKMYSQKNVVEEVEDDSYEIALEDAILINPNYKVGDIYETEINIDEFQRAVATYTKQQLKQKLREAEKKMIYDTYIEKLDDVIVGVVERVDPKYCLINVGKTNALMLPNGMIPGETYYVGQPIKVYVLKVEKDSQGAQVIVTRTAPGFLKRLFESEIMEIYDGIVEIRAIARDPGERAKVAVSSRDESIDAPGACIGQQGMRIQKITSQLFNEKIDVVQYYDETELFIAEALKPAHVYGLAMDYERKCATAVVPNEEFFSAIGKKGQNVKLAVKLTNWKIDIKTVDDALAEHLVFKSMDEIAKSYAPVVEELQVEEVVEVIEEVEEVVEIPTKVEEKVVEQSAIKEEVKVEVKDEVEEMLAKMPTPKIKAQHIPVVEQAKVEEEVVEETKEKTISKKAIKKAEELKAKAKEEEAKKNYMPVYTEEELKAIQEEEASEEYDDGYDDDLDYDEYDDYYED